MKFYFITIYLSLENLKLALFGCPKFKEQVAVLKAANLFFGGGGGGYLKNCDAGELCMVNSAYRHDFLL